MRDKVLLSYIVVDGIFVATGAIMLGFCVIIQNLMFETPTTGDQAARDLLYQQFPLTAGIVNSVLIFVTFLITIPGIVMPTRSWLKFGVYMTVVSAIFSMVLGLWLWIMTLKTKESFQLLWIAQPAAVQDLMQTQFQCCGYLNSTSPAFVTDATCPSPAAAALMKGCSAPITSFVNVFIDDIFTAVFGMVGIDAVFIVTAACLLKDRKERERFRHIDEKSGTLL
ncbi:hypothetical protein BR93DRAFT_572835 [Coniochaeta sp. PMI_546]|nr:hypothetical protein BR93DRAFT_572835 [Coniochaeta sp. PMI_546]